MGAKAEGAAQGYTVLGGIVLAILSIQMLMGGLEAAIAGDVAALVDVILAIALLLMVLLSFDACGFVSWKVPKSGLLLAIFGFIAMIIAGRGLSFNLIAWLTNIYILAGFMLLLAGLLLLLRR
ncbi:MAG: hypothetical protein RTU92_07625 [Candidatus Thorarchaeota archaeon]